MKNNSTGKMLKSSGRTWRITLTTAAAILAVMALPMSDATAETTERGGKEVVGATCGTCHATGKEGAPKIGDKQAWEKLAARGLTSLTQTALDGIRKMPPHGGSADASDREISRAIAYMINQSGGHWIEPAGKAAAAVPTTPPVERSGQYLVRTQCGKCHLAGENGAPKVGDRDAWVLRLKRGMDEVVRSAFNGHGAMPARGGLAAVTPNEMRHAITYMFNPASESMIAPVATPVATPSPYHKVIGNTEVFFGIASAQSIRDAQNKRGTASIANIPGGANHYYVNVSLRDRASAAVVTDAQVDARVEDPAWRGESKSLDIIAINKGISYGNFFRLPTKGHYVITVKIQRADADRPAEARFEFNRD